ncbi:MAG: hypothetical protein R3C03_09600 [Pirellulaceae bacterium]
MNRITTRASQELMEIEEFAILDPTLAERSRRRSVGPTSPNFGSALMTMQTTMKRCQSSNGRRWLSDHRDLLTYLKERSEVLWL